MNYNMKYSCKLVLLGETAVGKSCILARFINGEFREYQEPTIGAAFSTKEIRLIDKTVKFEIWDTAGQERYKSLAPMYYRGAKAAMVIYDITNNHSFNNAKQWVYEIQSKGHEDCLIILIGNKSDLENERKVSKDEVEQYCANNNLLNYLSSAKTGDNIDNIFLEIAKNVKLGGKKKITKEDLNRNHMIIAKKRNKFSFC